MTCSYRLLYFEQDRRGRFIAPGHYPELALATATTHDLPTLAGYWKAHDLDLRRRLNLFPTSRHERNAHETRARDRVSLLKALRREKLWGKEKDGLPAFHEALLEAIHVFLARTPSLILMVQLEDTLGETGQANLPGTADEHPNWQRRMSLDLDDMLANPRFVRLAARIRQARNAPAEVFGRSRAGLRRTGESTTARGKP